MADKKPVQSNALADLIIKLSAREIYLVKARDRKTTPHTTAEFQGRVRELRKIRQIVEKMNDKACEG